jgi:hypothetical protein
LTRLAVPRRGRQEEHAGELHLFVDDVEQRIFGELSDETLVYPGHGDDTTLAVDRGNIGEWRKRGW